ncbi:hypothetical protein AB1484_31600 [Parafrankia sp. FMc6]
MSPEEITTILREGLLAGSGPALAGELELVDPSTGFQDEMEEL